MPVMVPDPVVVALQAVFGALYPPSGTELVKVTLDPLMVPDTVPVYVTVTPLPVLVPIYEPLNEVPDCVTCCVTVPVDKLLEFVPDHTPV